VQEIVTPGPSRSEAVCSHFGRCGGCALQMMAPEPYLAWKRDSVLNALKQRGFNDAPVEEIRAVPPGTRRRAMFKARADSGAWHSGSMNPKVAASSTSPNARCLFLRLPG